MPESDSNAPRPDPSPPEVPGRASTRPPAPRKPERESSAFEGLIGQLFGGGEGGGKRLNKDGGEMGLLDHLEELRMTIVKCIMAIGIGMMIVGALFFKFIRLLEWPLRKGLGAAESDKVLRMAGPFDPFTIAIQASVFGGFLLALPLVAYFIIRFVVPGLTLREKNVLRPALLSALGLFLFGALGCFFFALPGAIKFSNWFSGQIGIQSLWDADKYFGLVVWSTLGMGVLFEFPLVLAILQMLGIVETQTLRRFWRQALVVILVLASVAAPSPDPVSMLAIALPMVLLYAGSLVVGARMRKKYLAKQAQKEAEEQETGM